MRWQHTCHLVLWATVEVFSSLLANSHNLDVHFHLQKLLHASLGLYIEDTTEDHDLAAVLVC